MKNENSFMTDFLEKLEQLEQQIDRLLVCRSAFSADQLEGRLNSFDQLIDHGFLSGHISLLQCKEIRGKFQTIRRLLILVQQTAVKDDSRRQEPRRTAAIG